MKRPDSGAARKGSRTPEIDGKRRILAIVKSICVRSKGENEVVEGGGGGGGVGGGWVECWQWWWSGTQ